MSRIWVIAVLVALAADRLCSAQAPPTPGGLPPDAFQPPATTMKEADMPVPRDLPPSAGVKQDSLVTIDWAGPSLAQVGEVLEYTLQVRNTSALALHKVQANVEVFRTCRVYSRDRKSTRLNSSHSQISYAVFCLKKKNKQSYCFPHHKSVP